MALLPILAFFFCSAGPFLFSLFALRQLAERVRDKLTKEEKGLEYKMEEEVDDKINNFVASPEYTRVCQSMPEFARVCQSMQEYARICQSMPEYARVCKSMLEYARVCQSMPEYARVCKSMLEYARVRQSMPEYARVCQSLAKLCHYIAL